MMISFFVDPVLRAPTLGSILMCIAAGLMGCLVFLQRRSLVGEALSHATYPGVTLSIWFAALFLPFSEGGVMLVTLLGAFATGLLGQWAIEQMEKKLPISSDAALCFVLSVFFGIGVLVSSHLQLGHPLWYRQIQVFLFGQAATMLDSHILLYGILAFTVILSLSLLFRRIQILYFDPHFAKIVGVPTPLIQGLTHILLVLSIVVGMRSVGVVLMSAMLIAPAVGARQWTERLSTFFFLAALFGAISGFFGNFLSVTLPQWMNEPRLSLPTGPMIVLSATILCLFSLLFAPHKGYVSRMVRLFRFRLQCRQENLLKALYKKREIGKGKILLWRMKQKGWVVGHSLTEEGIKRAEKLIRLHRLWEVYLVHMGQGVERVHHSAEEMEHILNAEIEKELLQLLNHPVVDPHLQPIPQEEPR